MHYDMVAYVYVYNNITNIKCNGLYETKTKRKFFFFDSSRVGASTILILFDFKIEIVARL